MSALPPDVLAIGFGGNVGDHAAILDRFRRAREALGLLGEHRSAPLYVSAPLGPAQPRFLNTVVRLRISDAIPGELLATLHELERLLGRDRNSEARWGPRSIDLDLLLWGTRILATPELELPHPRLGERRFVIAPLIDLFGDELVVPGTNQTLRVLAAAVGSQQLEPHGDW